MTLRVFILLITAPVFLLLGLTNAALLYESKHAALEAGMREEARAAAVTLAAFAGSGDDLADFRRPGTRRRDLIAAARLIPDLEAIAVVRRDGAVLPLHGPPPQWAAFSPRGRILVEDGGEGLRVRAIEPLSADSAVLVELNGRSYRAQMRGLVIQCASIVGGVGMVGILLSLWLARRFGRELRAAAIHMRATRERQGGRARKAGDADYSLRELGELVHAVEVMEALSRNTAERPAVLPPAERLFDAGHLRAMTPPVDRIVAGRRVTARMLGAPEPGALIAVAETPGGGALLLATVERDDPGVALSLAQALRPVAEAWLKGAADKDDFRRLAGAVRFERVDWTRGPAAGRDLHILASTETVELARNYQALGLAADAGELLDGLTALLPPDAGGLFAVLEPQPAEASAASASS